MVLMFIRNTFIVLTVLFSCVSPCLAEVTHLNVIVIFTDDQGYQDLGCFGSPTIKTPRIDRMAREGRRFTSFYAASSVCTPSRAGLLTGCYPARVGMTRVLFPDSTTGLHPDEVTLADMFKTNDYATLCIGKWHLGDHPDFMPTRQGFDHYFGIPYSNDMTINTFLLSTPTTLFREGQTLEGFEKARESGKRRRNEVPLVRDLSVVEFPADQTSLTQRYTAEAVSFIASHTKKPFFLYLAHTMPHVPLHASSAFKGTSDGGSYGDTIEEIDASVGTILDALVEHGLNESTLVVFTSDNGPWLARAPNAGSALPLRGGKFQTFEGGQRVPCVMWAPGRIPAGSVSDGIASTLDLLPTFASMIGAPLDSALAIDGLDIGPLIMRKDEASARHEFFYFRANSSVIEAVRRGKWKYRVGRTRWIKDKSPTGRAAREAAKTKVDDLKKELSGSVSKGGGRSKLRKDLHRVTQKYKRAGYKSVPVPCQLFNLETDIGEEHNLISNFPAIAKEMSERLLAFGKIIRAEARPAGHLAPADTGR